MGQTERIAWKHTHYMETYTFHGKHITWKHTLHGKTHITWKHTHYVENTYYMETYTLHGKTRITWKHTHYMETHTLPYHL